jgi:hypothetical protein
MKTCSSIRYGGLLVDAKDCDYTSFKHLGLVCPICHRSVFLCVGSERKPHERKLKDGSKTQVKESRVDAYFAHHPDVSKDVVNDCELRSSQITKVQREKIAAKSRNQRRKILQAHFWKILQTSPEISNMQDHAELFHSTWLHCCIYSKMKAEKEYQLLINYCVNFFRKEVEQNLKNLLHKWKGFASENFEDEKFKETSIDQSFVKELNKHWQSWDSAIDISMQREIVTEACLFLSTKMQYPILSKLCSMQFAICVAQLATMDSSGLTENSSIYDRAYPDVVKSLIGIDIKQLEKLLFSTYKKVIRLLLTINWAEQFEKLQEQELAKNIVAS